MFWSFRPNYIELPWHQVGRLIEQAASGVQYYLTDRYYMIPEDPSYIMRKIKSYKHIYQEDKRDCDDFVRIFRGILSQKGYGNILAMDMAIQTPGGKHNLIGFIKDNQIVFGEPQTGEIIEYDNYKIIRMVA